jgi:hypothetical protein
VTYRDKRGRFIAPAPWAWHKGQSGNPGGRKRQVLDDEQAARAAALPTPVCTWIESCFIDPSTVKFRSATKDYSRAKTITLEPYQRRILECVLTPAEDGRFPYSLVVWSQPKKSGKTTVAAGVASWWAATVEAPNEILVCANDQEQAQGRVFQAMGPTLYKLGVTDWPVGRASIPLVVLPNGTTVRALPSSYATESGSNHGLITFDELWAYSHERARRLFEELCVVPTRLNSLVWITTYAGYWDESDLLRDIWSRVFADQAGSQLQPGVTVVPELSDITTTDGNGNARACCYARPGERFFLYWDHTPRMPWQTASYYRQQKATLRPTAYIRLHENRWQETVGSFIEEAWWERSVTLQGPSDERAVFALDASQRNDTTALVGVKRDGERYKTTFVRAWDPQGADLDLEATVVAAILELHERGLVEELWYDPYQLHQIGMNLRQAGIAAHEFSQGEERLRGDGFLYRLYRDGKIDNFDDTRLAAHIRAAKAKEFDDERIRLVKPKLGATQARKIDLAVAQSMAAYRASFTQTEGGIEVPAPAWFGGGEAPERDPRYIIGAPHRDTYWHRKWARQHYCPMCFEDAKRNNPHLYD